MQVIKIWDRSSFAGKGRAGGVTQRKDVCHQSAEGRHIRPTWKLSVPSRASFYPRGDNIRLQMRLAK